MSVTGQCVQGGVDEKECVLSLWDFTPRHVVR